MGAQPPPAKIFQNVFTECPFAVRPFVVPYEKQLNAMNSPTSDSKHILLFKGMDWDLGVSHEETQRRMDRVMAWMDGLQKRGIVVGGSPLAREGRVVSKKTSVTVADGPFAESKEVVGGYLIVQVDKLEEAVSIARDCPTLDFGIEIEVRPMLDDCPIFKRLREQQALAAAA